MLLTILLLECLLIAFTYSVSQHPLLIVVSFDAFRYDYFSSKTVPNMNRLRQLGTYSDYLVNVFPTKTFPNHHSIATGLYAESHGVIGNTYYDQKNQKVVHISYDMFHYNDNIVPIWRRNEDAGKGRYSGVMMWPGGCYPYQGKNVTYCHDYEPGLDWFARIDMIIKWIKDPAKPANLLMVYFEEPDTHGHIFGTDSEQVNDLISKLDNITFYIEQQLKINQLTEKVNVIHLSDHGMVNVKPPNFINVTQYLTPNTYTFAGSTPVLQFFPVKGRESEVHQKLVKGSETNGHFKVYRKDEYLDRWHYKNNLRTPPILVIADVGYGLDDLIIGVASYSKKHNINVTNNSQFGVHGYDYTEKEMHPFFMARGPKIKESHKVTPFNLVDLYNLFCNILEIEPPRNNGTTANIIDVMRQGNQSYSLSSIFTMAAIGTVIVLILIGCAAIITLMMIKRQQSITTTAALNKRFPQTFQSSYEAQLLLEPEDA